MTFTRHGFIGAWERKLTIPHDFLTASVVNMWQIHIEESDSEEATEMALPSRLGFGIFLAPFHAPFDNPTLALERDLELLEWLDYLGYDEAWIGEHHSCGWETIASPEIFIAAAAQRTPRTARPPAGALGWRHTAAGRRPR